MAELGRADGWVNLARVYQREGRIPDALSALEKAAAHKEPAAPWVINWLTGQINASNNQLEAAVASFEAVLKTRIPERKFDFGLDFLVIDEMASALYTMARPLPVKSQERKKWLTKAIAAYHRTLAIDSEDVGRITDWVWLSEIRPGEPGRWKTPSPPRPGPQRSWIPTS